MADKRLVLFGAGMTGRGQVAQLAYEDGWALTLIDRKTELVNHLNHAGRYTVQLLSEQPRQVVIAGYRVLHTGESAAIAEAIKGADLGVTSVLEPNLADVAKILAPALIARIHSIAHPLNIIAAENMNNSSSVLGGYVRKDIPDDMLEDFDHLIGFPDSMIARVVPVARDPLFIVAEEFSEWTADRSAVRGELPQLKGLEWVANQTARLQRKLYIHNTGHAVCGYLGWLAGYTYIHEAAQDARIMGRISEAISESGEAISRQHGFSRDSVRAYEDNLKGRLVISALPDDLRRVIRQPIRKLGKEERFLGPLMLCEAFNLPSSGLCYGMAALLLSRMPGDEQFDRIASVVDRAGPVEALNELVGYKPSDKVAEQIIRAFHELKGKSKER